MRGGRQVVQCVAAWRPHSWPAVLGPFLGFGQQASVRRTVCGSEAAVSLKPAEELAEERLIRGL